MFKTSGELRATTRILLFRPDGTVRPALRRIVYKKNGSIRPEFAYWAAAAGRTGALADTSAAREAIPYPEEIVLRDLPPFADQIARWRKSSPPPAGLPAAELLAKLPGAGDVVLVISHDNYREVPGGVQLCQQREEAEARARGLIYLQAHPWQPLPALAAAQDDYLVTLLCNGAPIGTAAVSELVAAVAHMAAAGRATRLVIHQLLGHSPEAVTRLAAATGKPKALFWLHDFLTLCPSYTLQRNTLRFCGAPPETSNACGLCSFGTARPDHLARLRACFDAVDVTIVAPSQVALEFFASHDVGLRVATTEVVPHLTLEPVARAKAAPVATPGGPIRLGFLGTPAPHKGWPVFDALIKELPKGDFTFTVLCAKRPNAGETEWRPVHVTDEAPEAMSEAVAASNIDFVLHWASWPETFSFTTFEALAGDAFVLTNVGSGNVAAAVEASGRGAVLADQAALRAFLCDGRARALAEQRRAALGANRLAARHSAMSFSVPGWV